MAHPQRQLSLFEDLLEGPDELKRQVLLPAVVAVLHYQATERPARDVAHRGGGLDAGDLCVCVCVCV